MLNSLICAASLVAALNETAEPDEIEYEVNEENTQYFDCDPELDEAECEKQAQAWM